MSSLQSTQVKIWYFITFLLGLIEGMIGTFFPLVFVAQGGSLFQLSLILSLVSLVGAFQSLWGSFLDRFHKPKLLGSSSLLIQSGTIFTMALSGSPQMFGGARVGNSLSTSAYNNANAYLRSSYFSNSRRGRMGNLFVGFNLLGVAFGVFSTGLIYNKIGFKQFSLIHLLAAILSLMVLVLFFFFLPEFREDLVQDEQLRFAMIEERADLNYSMKDIITLSRKSKGLLLFILVNLVFNFSVGLSGPFFIIEMSERWSLNTLEIGLITTFNAVLQVLIIFLFTPVVDIINRKMGFTIGIALAIIPVIAMVMPTTIISVFGSSFIFWMVVYAISSIGWGLVNALSLTLLIDYVNPKVRGSVIGIYGSLQALVTFFAGLVAAVLIVLFPSTILIFYLSIIGRITALILLFFTNRPPLPSSDYYIQRKIFFSRFSASFERGVVWIPVVGKILTRIRRQDRR